MKLSDLHTEAEIHERDMRSPEYRREYDRTRLANDVALRVLVYRTERNMSQTELARKLNMRQPNIARLESGEHEPSFSTLVKLSSILGLDFSIVIKGGGLKVSQPARARWQLFAVSKTTGKVVKGKSVAKDPKRRGGYTLGAAARPGRSAARPPGAARCS